MDRQSALDPDALVPPAASAAWTPPAPLSPTPPAAPAVPALDADRTWDLPALVDLALATHPDTRGAWQRMRAAAARLGATQAAWLPVLALAGQGGWQQIVYPTPRGTEVARASSVSPSAELAWLVADFGRRASEREAARQELVGAGCTFTRTQQAVAFGVQRAFYDLAARRAAIAAADATVAAASATLEQVQAQHATGVATWSDVLLARQEVARAAFEREDAVGRADDAWAALATALGVPPTVKLRVATLQDLAMPPALPAAVDAVVEAALATRPDLAAQQATVRARAARVERARAELWPRVRLDGTAGDMAQQYRAGPPYQSFGSNDGIYSGFLTVEWTLFAGGARTNAVRAAQAELGDAEADLDRQALVAMREVWTAYVDVRTALRKTSFAQALLAASSDAYAAAGDAYRHGLGTLIDLLAAQRDLDRARTTDIQTRAQLLTAAAALAFAAGGPVGS